jgi:UDP-2,4-diacetamido-2,4,6-trideoxy-beta-L-altropyranose hydrolase
VSPPRVTLRPAALDDAELLLAWANDPATRATSLSSRRIGRPEHVGWLTDRLADASSGIWIGLGPDESTPVGVVRFELDGERIAVVSITVAPAARGQGVGTGLLRAGLLAARVRLRPGGFRAWVKRDNEASIRLFEGAGFRRLSDATLDRLEFQLPASA